LILQRRAPNTVCILLSIMCIIKEYKNHDSFSVHIKHTTHQLSSCVMGCRKQHWFSLSKWHVFSVFSNLWDVRIHPSYKKPRIICEYTTWISVRSQIWKLILKTGSACWRWCTASALHRQNLRIFMPRMDVLDTALGGQIKVTLLT
jgi:hypothetical protein